VILNANKMRASAFLFEFMAAIWALIKLPYRFLIIGRDFLAMPAHLHYFFDGIENDLCPDWVHALIIHLHGNCRKATWGACQRVSRLWQTQLSTRTHGLLSGNVSLKLKRAEERSASALMGTINQCTVAVAVGFNMDLPTPTLRVCFVQDLHNASSTMASTAQSDLRQTVASSLTTR
jgi:hypothetical protein